MQYENICRGSFISRPNRFIAVVEIDGVEQRVHVKNTGRCAELLVPGNTVYLEKSSNQNRKTAYDLVAVEKRAPEGARLIRETLTPRGDEKAAGFEINEDTMKMMGGFTMLRLTGMLGMAGIKLTKEELLALNEKLNQIEKV